MKNFKLKLSTLTLGLISINVSAQQLPTNTSPAGVGPSGQNNQQFWSRAGNNPTFGINNIFGTNFNSPVYHYTNGQNRMILFDDTWNTAGSGVSGSSTPNGGGLALNLNPASPVSRPASLLTISNGNPNFAGGWRNWMQVGTFNYEGFNQLYAGMKPNAGAGGGADALINWGDNTLVGGATPAYMRFNFTAPLNDLLYPPYQRSADGLDVMRMNWLGRVGIGNYENNPIEAPVTKDPARRLEILSDKTTVGGNGRPLLRLTHTQQNTSSIPLSISTGKFSEFQPMATGDLFITMRNNNLVTTPSRDFKERYVGINTNAPGNTLEINSQYSNALTPNGFGGTGWAGVRFSDLNSTSTTTLTANKLLSVNANGDVILVTNITPTVSSLGNLCGAASNSLTNSWEIPMSGFNFNHTMPIFSNSQVNIGYPLCTTNSARIAVFNDTLRAAGGFTTQGDFHFSAKGVVGLARNFQLNNGSNLPGAIGVTGIAEADGQANIIGVLGQSIASLFGTNYGGYFEAKSALSWNIGAYTYAEGGSTAIGLKSEAFDGANVNIAVSGRAYKTPYPSIVPTYPGGVSIGIYGDAPFSTSATAPAYAGYFDGDVYINGIGTSPTGMFTLSDQNIKSNVAKVSKPLDLLLKLRPVSYNLNNTYAPQLNVDTAKTFGLIAQEVAVLFPTLVKDIVVPAMYDSLGSVTTPSVALKSLNYTGLIPLTISAIQDINSRQNVMQTQINKTGLSDALVKTNINNFNALAKIKTLNPVSYNFTNASVPQLTFTPQLDYGFVAQQIQTVYPELVDTLRIPAKYDSLGAIVNVAQVLKTVNYKAMSALLTRAIQEQQTKIDSLIHVTSKQDSINNAVQTQISNLTSMINACCSNPGAKTSNPSINQQDVELSDKDAIVLEQNVPNPFAEQTTITYNVPASVNKAQLLFFNATGQVIQTVDIKTRGKGKVNVFASDLSSGLYHYTLVADGKVVDSKKMVRE